MGRANLKRGGLTQPQWELLANRVCEYFDGVEVVDYYPPAKALVAKGLCYRRSNGLLYVTEAGRKLVEAVRSAEETG